MAYKNETTPHRMFYNAHLADGLLQNVVQNLFPTKVISTFNNLDIATKKFVGCRVPQTPYDAGFHVHISW